MIPLRRKRERWLFGFAVLCLAVLVVTHTAEESAILSLVGEANPPFFSLAILLQLATYAVQGGSLRNIAGCGGVPLSKRESIRLTLAKLFIDQSLPSGGLSGTTFVTRVLRHRGGSEERIIAGALQNILAFQLASVLGLIATIGIAAWLEHSTLISLAAALLIVPSLLIIGLLLIIHRYGTRFLPNVLTRHLHLEDLAALIKRADPTVLRSPRILAKITGAQSATLILDALTLWAAIESFGGHQTPFALFPAFMVASAVKTFGFVPGGLGVFEAASTAAMTTAGVPPALALSGTLLFRGLSYWIPMVPGCFIARSFHSRTPPVTPALTNWWSFPIATLLTTLQTSPAGLTTREATARREEIPAPPETRYPLSLELRSLFKQLKSPLLLLLVFAALAAAVSGEWADSLIVLLIIAGSAGLAATKESNAQRAVEALRSQIAHHVNVIRDGRSIARPAHDIVPGDLIQLSAGSIVPADGVLLTANALYLNEAALTGEPFPVEKRPSEVSPLAPLTERSNTVFAGSHVLTGSGTALAVLTGRATTFGAITERLQRQPAPTEFERSLRNFGYLVLSCMAAMTCLLFFLNVQLGRAPIETLLFSVALAVGLSPELLPATLTINLARGADVMAKVGVLTRHTNGIENLGAIDTLCTDKTGTLTAGVITVDGSFNHRGEPTPDILELAAINATLQSGLPNPLDEAIIRHTPSLPTDLKKIGEVGYDFSRKRISVVAEKAGQTHLIMKGAFESVLSCCTITTDGAVLDEKKRAEIRTIFERWSTNGLRVLGVAARPIPPAPRYLSTAENSLTFLGFVTFVDSPKPDAAQSITDLQNLGISTRIVSGDNALVCRHVAAEVGISTTTLMTGAQIKALHGPALWQAIEATHVFAEIEPAQKEDIVIALKRLGHVVGFLGDGINDTPAMHAADVSISVEGAVDIARESADFVLLQRHLDILRRGVEEGRRTFVNTLKYIRMTMSANLGNTISMAIGSVVLPFLPLLPGQILLNNFLSDIPALALAGDAVDPELIRTPERLHLGNVARFMLVFGLISSCFDLLTLGALVLTFGLIPEPIRSGWFLESLLTELVILLIVRTHRPVLQSKPSPALLWLIASMALLGLTIPALSFAHRIGFTTLTPPSLALILGIVCLYALASEAAKRPFFRRNPVL